MSTASIGPRTRPSMPQSSRQLPLVKLLVEHGADVNQAMKAGTTPLMVAASCKFAEGQDEMVKIVSVLLEKGARVDAHNAAGASALSIAKEGEMKKIAAVLEHAGAKP